jgi:PAS domain S-box-containing protein
MEQRGGSSDQHGQCPTLVTGVQDERVFRAAFENAREAMLLFDDDCTILEANAAACALAGVPREQIVGRTSYDFHPPADRARMEAATRELLRCGQAFVESTLVCADGSLRFLEVSSRANVVPGCHISVIRDVTEQRRREAEAQRYALLSRRARDIVLFIGRDGRILEANEAAVRAYGYSREELLGLNVRDLRAPGTRDNIAEQLELAFTEGALFETVHCRRDGGSFPVEVSSRSAEIAGERVLLSIIRDTTERKQMQARLIQADRMASVGTLAAGVAHEINNPLAYAMVNTEIALRRLGGLVAALRGPGSPPAPRALAEELEEIHQMLGVAYEGAERVRGIVRDLRTFARADEERRGTVDVRQVLDAVINIAANEIRHRARLLREYGDAPLVHANEARLGQVFLNLLVNAAQAIPDGDAAHHEIRVVTGTDARGACVVEVHDTGAGIPPEILGRIFDPFMTTRPVGGGTGLGLFISQSIVAAYGGEITVRSRVGHGSSFTVRLPPMAGAHAVVRPTPPTPSPGGGPASRRGRVLVVDDEIEIAQAVRDALGHEHVVVTTTSGREALSRLAEGEAFDLVLCDLMMPDTAGAEVYEAVLRLRPELAERFVFMTGGAFTPRAREFASAMAPRCLSKPFDLDALRALARASVRDA